MDLKRAETLARRLMLEHGLADWTFRFDRARRRFGLCDYSKKTISLSRHLTELNGEAQVRDTILHEIAHALSPGAGHGPRWRELCVRLGAKPLRLFADEVTRPASKYLLVCPRCRQTLSRERRSRRKVACKPCCDAYSGGRYSARYGFVWKRLE